MRSESSASDSGSSISDSGVDWGSSACSGRYDSESIESRTWTVEVEDKESSPRKVGASKHLYRVCIDACLDLMSTLQCKPSRG